MSNVTPINPPTDNVQCVQFRRITSEPMDPETTLHSMQALFGVIRDLLAQDPVEWGPTCGTLAQIGEHLADQLTDRI